MGIVFHLFDVLLLDLTHKLSAMEQVGVQLGRYFTGDGVKLISSSLTKGDRAAGRNEVSSPLINHSEIPNHQAGEPRAGHRNGKPPTREQSGEIIKKQGKPKNENGSEGHEEAIPERRDACPIRIDGDE
jgi:hypothetical protein